MESTVYSINGVFEHKILYSFNNVVNDTELGSGRYCDLSPEVRAIGINLN